MNSTPPTGTTTFLFTSIEGSTTLWEANPASMRQAVGRHDDLLREALEGHGGYLFKRTGDGIAAAFTTAAAALRAALTAQLSLAKEPWPDSAKLRVRMGLHIGAAELRDGDYFGTVVNRTARLMAAGHGGQTLLSEAAQQLSRDSLPAGASLRPLGEHRLKDLARGETIYQLDHVDLPDTFAALQTLDNPAFPNNLPLQLTSFVGRQQALAEIHGLFGRTHLLTLTGAGGTGKTRLSIEVATDVLDRYREGAWLVELAPLTDPTLVARTVAATLHIKEQSGQTIEQSLVTALHSAHLLLILDNCEHLVQSCAQLAAALLGACPHVRILTTSREPLGIAGEQVYRVPALSLPPTDTRVQTLESLRQFESVRLFVERAGAVRSDFAPSDVSAPALGQLCRRLDGIPLAIELAAARIRSLSIEDINDRLDRSFLILTGGNRAALPRQQTLRALVDWSYDLLNQNERLLLGRLSIFSGGWTLAAAEAICAFDPIEDWEMLDLLTALVDKSMVVADVTEMSGDFRYTMLETLRQYAVEKRNASHESYELGRRHFDHFLALAEKAEANSHGAEQVAYFHRLGLEIDNFRAAIDWLNSNEPDPAISDGTEVAHLAEQTMAINLRLWWFWERRGSAAEGRERVGKALALARRGHVTQTRDFMRGLTIAAIFAQELGEDTSARALLDEAASIGDEAGNRESLTAVHIQLGNLQLHRGDITAARESYRQCVALARELGQSHSIATGLNNLANVECRYGNFADAYGMYEESLAISRGMEDIGNIALATGNLGYLAALRGDNVAARRFFEEGLQINRILGNRYGVAAALLNLGGMSEEDGDLGTARARQIESLAISRQIGAGDLASVSLGTLAVLLLKEGDSDAACAYVSDCLTIGRAAAYAPAIALGIALSAELALLGGDPERALRLLGALDAFRDLAGSNLTPTQEEKLRLLAKTARSVVAQVRGAAATDAAWDEGRGLTWRQAVELALS